MKFDFVGCYHDVSDGHLQQYINETVYRWNTRKMSESERFAHMFVKLMTAYFNLIIDQLLYYYQKKAANKRLLSIFCLTLF